MTTKKSAALRFLEDLSGGPISLAKLLEAIRLGEGMTQVQFAKTLGVSRAHLCDIENGRRAVSPARAAKFAKILGHAPERFVKLALQDELDRAGLKFRVDVEAA